jgi:uncharacterized protein (DUF1778 family)
MAVEKRETDRISLHIHPGIRAVIEQAAALSNKTRTDFMIDAAYHAAQEVLLDQRLFLLNNEQWNSFNAKLDTHPKSNEKLVQLFQKKAPWE